MTLIDLEPSDKKMADRWMMHTEFMLRRVGTSDLKRIVEDLRDGMNYAVNDEGNIVETDLGPIDRDREELNERICKKVEDARQPIETIEEKLVDLKQDRGLPGTDNQKHEGKIEALEEVLEEVDPNHE